MQCCANGATTAVAKGHQGTPCRLHRTNPAKQGRAHSAAAAGLHAELEWARQAAQWDGEPAAGPDGCGGGRMGTS
jgi:hypothetical protein